MVRECTYLYQYIILLLTTYTGGPPSIGENRSDIDIIRAVLKTIRCAEIQDYAVWKQGRKSSRDDVARGKDGGWGTEVYWFEARLSGRGITIIIAATATTTTTTYTRYTTVTMVTYRGPKVSGTASHPRINPLLSPNHPFVSPPPRRTTLFAAYPFPRVHARRSCRPLNTR